MDIASFLDSERFPRPLDAERAGVGLVNWRSRTEDKQNRDLAEAMVRLAEDENGRELLAGVFANSPFLSDCILAEPGTLLAFLSDGPGLVLSQVRQGLKADLSAQSPRDEVVSALRRAKRKAALIIGLADLTDRWTTDEVIRALADMADLLVSCAVSHLLWQAAARGELRLAHPETPELNCGYTVLGMGKLGSQELNFSSDIDLIVVFDRTRPGYLHQRGPQEGFVRMTRELVRLLEERTADGYVFRTDLRLRPDPGAMPVAISYSAALTYYESMGQNWERAAMIKARPVAGDLSLGHDFLAELKPFIWRKNLDFLAIRDVHSIKRQINARRGGAKIAVRAHNIKLGRGGIREIEFFAQTQQLIWGGRDPSLRAPRTVEALHALAAAGHVDHGTADELAHAYRVLRRIENRLQMIADQQTHDLPAGDREVTGFAAFLGYDSAEDYEAELHSQLVQVERHYARLFEEEPDLAGPGNLVFTGGEPDPDTVRTLEDMGFSDGPRVFHMIRGWHHGRYRATRSTRAREILTELMPTLLREFSRTPDPDQALLRFDQFLSGLPAGVQLFTMLHARPLLLDLIAEIMGGAPLLGEQLGRNPGLLDAVLSPGFFARIPGREALEQEFADAVAQARDFEDLLDLSRRWANERKFQAGVQILRQSVDVDESGRALSDIAGTVLRGILAPAQDQLAARHGRIPGAKLAVVAMGKLGGREMTVSSDLDLIFLYEVPKGCKGSDGDRPLAPAHYFARLAQRYINALTAMTGEGRLYEIDMRLRPSGKSGPLASSLAGFQAYYQGDAWTWEHMALTRARLLAGEADFMARAKTAIRDILIRRRDPARLLADVASMRHRVEGEKAAKSLWSVKYLRGGLVDLEFIAQYLQLRHAHDSPQVLSQSTQDAFARLAEAGHLEPDRAAFLIEAVRLCRRVQGILRLTVGPAFDADGLPAALQGVLAREAGMPDFTSLRAHLADTAKESYRIFQEIIEQPAERLKAAPTDDSPGAEA